MDLWKQVNHQKTFAASEEVVVALRSDGTIVTATQDGWDKDYIFCEGHGTSENFM